MTQKPRAALFPRAQHHLWARGSGLMLGRESSLPFEAQQQASPPQEGPQASHCYSKSALSLFYGSSEDR